MVIWGRVSVRFEGIHSYKDAPKDVSFLRFPHRHEFHATVWFQQFHDDRDIEYIRMKRWLQTQVTPAVNLAGKSCERFSQDILELVKEQYGPHRGYKVEVLEDGEHGAMVEYVPE